MEVEVEVEVADRAEGARNTTVATIEGSHEVSRECTLRVSVCVCVYVREREGKREREKKRRNTARARARNPVDKLRVCPPVLVDGRRVRSCRHKLSRRRRREVILDYRLDTTILGADQRPTAD